MDIGERFQVLAIFRLNDKFFEFKNLASEVDISRNSIKITEIKFE